jgi:hypothetical protein
VDLMVHRQQLLLSAGLLLLLICIKSYKQDPTRRRTLDLSS